MFFDMLFKKKQSEIKDDTMTVVDETVDSDKPERKYPVATVTTLMGTTTSYNYIKAEGRNGKFYLTIVLQNGSTKEVEFDLKTEVRELRLH